MRNWKSTVTGCASAFLMALAQIPAMVEYHEALETAASFFLALLALSTKDHNVTGGTVHQ